MVSGRPLRYSYGTHVSFSTTGFFTLNCGRSITCAYTQLRSNVRCFVIFTLFSKKSKSAEGNLVGFAPPPGTKLSHLMNSFWDQRLALSQCKD